MPNWCANRLLITAPDLSGLHALVRGTQTPWYAQAVGEGRQFFAAGCAGILRPVEPVNRAPYPALCTTRPGQDTPENRAYSDWLTLLMNGAELTRDRCGHLHDLWLGSGLAARHWESLSGEEQAEVERLFRNKRHDWGTTGDTKVELWWNNRCRNTPQAEGQVMDMLLLLPTRLDVEVNGFNGKLLDGVPSGYDWYSTRYGIKWPCGFEVGITEVSGNCLQVDFDTPWCPPSGAVLAALSAQYGCTVKHWYAECGCDFCGFSEYSGGELTEWLEDALEWGDEDEDGGCDVCGPDWLVGNVAHFGG